MPRALMQSLLATLIVLCSPALGKTDVADLPETVVTVVMAFEDDYSPVLVDAMKQELGFVMRRSHLQFDWRLYEDALGKEVSNRLMVVRFKGKCQMMESLPAPGATTALGLTHISEGSILPYTDVHCDRIRNLVVSAIRSESFLKTEFFLGRALGRVLAHELYHIFANTTRHGNNGISKAVLTPQELVQGQLEIEDTEAALINRNLAPPAAEVAGK